MRATPNCCSDRNRRNILRDPESLLLNRSIGFLANSTRRATLSLQRRLYRFTQQVLEGYVQPHRSAMSLCPEKQNLFDQFNPQMWGEQDLSTLVEIFFCFDLPVVFSCARQDHIVLAFILGFVEDWTKTHLALTG
eukprot:3671276-Amphidinium_carterae.1